MRTLGGPPRAPSASPRRHLGLYFVAGLLVALFQLFGALRIASPRLPASSSADSTSATTSAGNAIPLCRMEQLKTGAWRPQRLPTPPYDPLEATAASMGACYAGGALDMHAPYDTHVWEAEAARRGTCRFPQARHRFRDEFCALTRHKTVAFVGDSLTLDQFTDIGLRTGWERAATSDNASFDRQVFAKENTDTNFAIRTCPPDYTTRP